MHGFNILSSKFILEQAGEEITTSYLKPSQATFVRRHLLHEKWKFWCLCNRCQDPAELGSNIGGRHGNQYSMMYSKLLS
jgi:hypothetical protein